MAALDLYNLSAEEQLIFGKKVKETEIQYESDTFEPYVIIDGERYSMLYWLDASYKGE